MGWNSEDGKHEGWLVGFVPRDGCSAESGLLRELEYPTDNRTCRPVALAAGCDCGWRSPRWHVSSFEKVSWYPFSISASERYENRCHELWKEHVQHEQRPERFARTTSTLAPRVAMDPALGKAACEAGCHIGAWRWYNGGDFYVCERAGCGVLVHQPWPGVSFGGGLRLSEFQEALTGAAASRVLALEVRP